MSSLIVLDGFDPPKACETCPFLDQELSCCEILSAAKNKAVMVNLYLPFPDKKCPFYHLEDGHGRLLDEKDIRLYFESMRYGDEDIDYSIYDIHKGLDSVLEVAPEYSTVIKRSINTCGDAIKQLLMSPKDIEEMLENATKTEEELNGREDNQV